LGLATVPIILSHNWPAGNLVINEEKLNISAIVLDTAVNVMITTMISIRILSIYRMTDKDTIPIQLYARKHLNVVAMLVESAAPCAILGILFCVGQFMDIGSRVSSFALICYGVVGQTWSMSIVSGLFHNTRQNN
jgi:hypothetical protein